MTTELTMLALAALLQIVQLLLFALPANLEVGTARLLKPRDEPVDHTEELSIQTARLGRAFANHNEGLLLFAVAVTVVTLSGQSSGLTAACAIVYLVARLLYIPAYAFAWVPWRSGFWGLGFFATTIMLLAALF